MDAILCVKRQILEREFKILKVHLIFSSDIVL